MGFEKLLFISYAHIDNQPLPPHHDGWISRFHASLEAMLSMRIGRKAQIWRDDKLDGNDEFAAEIVDQLERTAMMISVLTPRYLEAPWCMREVREFCERAERSGGLARANKSRVFKILKSPIKDRDALPAALRNVLGYEFFTFEDGAPLELDDAFGERFGQDYNRRVGKLAWDLSQLLEQIESDGSGVPSIPKPAVYLAESSHDRSEFREMLEAELKLHGHPVLPDQRLPLDDEAACVELVEQQLARCSLAIHLVGNTAGAVPDGPGCQPLVALQNRLAARYSHSNGLPRLIWLPADTHSEQPAHQAFIQALQDDAETQFGADLISADIEAFKAEMHAALRRLEKPMATPAGAAARLAPLIYLICVDKDRKTSVPMRKLFKEQGIDVELPAFEGDAGAIREANQNLLAGCDAVLVYYGAGDEAWKRSTDAELKKLRGLLGDSARQLAYTYLAEPRTGDKDDLLDMQAPKLIDGLAGFDAATLAPLMDALRASRPTP